MPARGKKTCRGIADVAAPRAARHAVALGGVDGRPAVVAESRTGRRSPGRLSATRVCSISADFHPSASYPKIVGAVSRARRLGRAPSSAMLQARARPGPEMGDRRRARRRDSPARTATAYTCSWYWGTRSRCDERSRAPAPARCAVICGSLAALENPELRNPDVANGPARTGTRGAGREDPVVDSWGRSRTRACRSNRFRPAVEIAPDAARRGHADGHRQVGERFARRGCGPARRSPCRSARGHGDGQTRTSGCSRRTRRRSGSRASARC